MAELVGTDGSRIFRDPGPTVPTTDGNSRIGRIEAGRRWLRLNLATTAPGVALHRVSQARQEFPEMAEAHARAHTRLGAPGETVQLLGRVGHAPAVPPTQRWPLETRMRDA